MADSRADVPVLERTRGLRRRVALTALLLAAVGAVVALLWPRPEHIENHAFAVPPPEHRIMVEVLNGTRRQGLARVATRILRKQGIDVVFLGNADSASAVTRVVLRRGEPDRARTVASALGISNAAEQRDTLRRVDVSVVLGDDFRPKEDLHP